MMLESTAVKQMDGKLRLCLKLKVLYSRKETIFKCSALMFTCVNKLHKLHKRI